MDSRELTLVRRIVHGLELGEVSDGPLTLSVEWRRCIEQHAAAKGVQGDVPVEDLRSWIDALGLTGLDRPAANLIIAPTRCWPTGPGAGDGDAGPRLAVLRRSGGVLLACESLSDTDDPSAAERLPVVDEHHPRSPVRGGRRPARRASGPVERRGGPRRVPGADAARQDWGKVLTIDARNTEAGRMSPGLASYARACWTRVQDELARLAGVGMGSGGGVVLFLHDAGLLGRYADTGGHDLLVGLQDAARRPDAGRRPARAVAAVSGRLVRGYAAEAAREARLERTGAPLARSAGELKRAA